MNYTNWYDPVEITMRLDFETCLLLYVTAWTYTIRLAQLARGVVKILTGK